VALGATEGCLPLGWSLIAGKSLKPLYGVPSVFAAHAVAGVGEGASSAWPASLSALRSILAGGRESMGRDTPRPDALRRLRCAAEGKGGAAWRRDRSRAQPRAVPGFGREHGEHGEDPLLARSEHRGTPADRSRQSYPQRKNSSSLSSDSGLRKYLILIVKTGSNQRKRAGRSEETGG